MLFVWVTSYSSESLLLALCLGIIPDRLGESWGWEWKPGKLHTKQVPTGFYLKYDQLSDHWELLKWLFGDIRQVIQNFRHRRHSWIWTTLNNSREYFLFHTNGALRIVHFKYSGMLWFLSVIPQYIMGFYFYFLAPLQEMNIWTLLVCIDLWWHQWLEYNLS